jgi:hypothetical protein
MVPSACGPRALPGHLSFTTYPCSARDHAASGPDTCEHQVHLAVVHNPAMHTSPGSACLLDQHLRLASTEHGTWLHVACRMTSLLWQVQALLKLLGVQQLQQLAGCASLHLTPQ